MKQFFNFSAPQKKVVIFLTILLALLSVYRFITGYAETDEQSLKFSIDVGDGEHGYRPPFKIDLNLSPADSLELLPGIGPVLASRIVAYRDSVKFEKPEDIVRVKGIGIERFMKLQPYLEVRGY
jgi:DNA uptake protein ComE-like DNA-binding protein